ncbi:FG-GAP repeat domain-containing protein [Chryseobacterium vrystaatense]|nr:VCBS repeat-containing protein [Chryseobacterium vrystaatense]
MKKLFIIAIGLFSLMSYSQSYYRNFFDNRGYDTSVGTSASSDQLEFSWAVPAHMEALVLMYEKTHDKKYAETLIKCIGNTIDRRDDLRDQVPGLSKIYDYRGISGAAWSTNHYNATMDSGFPYSHLVHSANITYPMAKFAAIVKLGGTAIKNLTSDAGGRYGLKTYDLIADDLIQKVKETLDYHNDQWYTDPNNLGYYKERSDGNPPIGYPGVVLPLNMQSSVGRVFVQMYRATSQNTYFDRLYKMANFLKSKTSLNSNLGSYSWTYWQHTDLRDDVSHAGLTAVFPYECYKYQIADASNNLIYAFSDIEKYTNTFTRDIYKSPLSINNGVNYTAQSWNVKYNTLPASQYDGYISYMWMYYSEYDRKIYQIIADLQAAKNYYENVTVDGSSLTIALLSNFENLIVPVNTEHLPGEDSDWRGVAKGNFDDDNDDEFVSIRNYDGMISASEPYNKNFRSVATTKMYGASYNWKGLAAGDFFGDNKSEIIALSDHTDYNQNGFYVLKIENNAIVEHAKYTGWGAQSDWVGVTAGNFISGGKDDVITVRNFNKEVAVHKFNGTDLQSVFTNTLNFPANAKIKAIASGNLDNDVKDEIVLLVDADDNNSIHNGIHVYDIDDNGVMTKVAAYTGWGSASDWKGLAVGDIDGDGVNEIVAHRNFDGEYRVFKLSGNSLIPAGSEIFPAIQTENSVMCLGNFNSASQNDELITLRKDGGIVMFSAAKVIKKTSNTNKKSDPCQDELPAELFSLLKSSFILKEKSETIASAQRGK